MRNLLIMLQMLLVMTTFAQEVDYYSNVLEDDIMSTIDYLDLNNVDDIEGIWSLGVTRRLTMDNMTYIERDESYSEWIIIKEGKKSVVKPVYDIPLDIPFRASFEKVGRDSYIYRCDFYELNWKVVTKAQMTSGNIIQYGYDADKSYLKKVYGKEYKSDMVLSWEFRWTKIYPKTIKS